MMGAKIQDGWAGHLVTLYPTNKNWDSMAASILKFLRKYSVPDCMGSVDSQVADIVGKAIHLATTREFRQYSPPQPEGYAKEILATKVNGITLGELARLANSECGSRLLGHASTHSYKLEHSSNKCGCPYQHFDRDGDAYSCDAPDGCPLRQAKELLKILASGESR